MNHFPNFIDALFQAGQLKLAPPEPISLEDHSHANELLNAFEKIHRDELPLSPPAFDKNAAMAASWAAETFFRAAQFIVYREIPAEQILDTFAQLNADQKFDVDRPSAHYGVDLVFRFLPDLMSFANSTNRQDPVCAAIRRWSIAWPLSSVGIELEGSLLENSLRILQGIQPDEKPVELHDEQDADVQGIGVQEQNELDGLDPILFDINSIIENDSLFQLYVDRILQTQDRSRMNDPRVIDRIKQSVGLHTTLAGKLKELLETE